jgi:hypothetical protein
MGCGVEAALSYMCEENTEGRAVTHFNSSKKDKAIPVTGRGGP